MQVDWKSIWHNPSQSEIFYPNQNSIRLIRAFQFEWIRTKFSIWTNPNKSEWLKLNSQSESFRTIPTSDSSGLKKLVRIHLDLKSRINSDWLGLSRCVTIWIARESYNGAPSGARETHWERVTHRLKHQTGLKTFLGLTRISSDTDFWMNRNKSD